MVPCPQSGIGYSKCTCNWGTTQVDTIEIGLDYTDQVEGLEAVPLRLFSPSVCTMPHAPSHLWSGSRLVRQL